MKHLVKLFLIVSAFLAMIAMVGCQDAGGTSGISGRVTDPEGSGIPNINVFTTDGTNYWSTITDENGNYSLSDVTPGSRVVAFYGPLWTTGYQSVVVGTSGVVSNITLYPSQISTVPLPVIDLNEPEVDQEVGLATITGTIANLDVENAVMITNGSSSLITTTEGAFETTAILRPGVNTIYIWAANQAGWTISDVIVITYTPSETMYFRATLTWDGAADVDLHTWDPNLEHCFYYFSETDNHQTISTGRLDIDNQTADGPENFTCTALEDGRFRLAVNSFDLRGNPSRQAFVRVVILSGPNAGTYTFGPYTFTQDNIDGEFYPVTGNSSTWWRPCDVLVNGTNISVVAPDSTELNENVSEMVRSRKK